MNCSNCYDTDSWEYLAPDEGTGRHVLDEPADTLDEILWELHEREQVQLASDAARYEIICDVHGHIQLVTPGLCPQCHAEWNKPHD